MKLKKLDSVVIRISGDSGDGIQLMGGEFSNTVAFLGNNIVSFSDFPAEIRAPQGTLFGVSGFQLHFGDNNIFTPGDKYDVLVVMNAAAFKNEISKLKHDGILIVNTDGFNTKNLRSAKYEIHPIEEVKKQNQGYVIYEIPIVKIVREALLDTGLKMKEIDRCKNMFALGFIYWLYSKELTLTETFLKKKFSQLPKVLDANLKILRKGFYYGETIEAPSSRYEVKKAILENGTYRNIRGNQAICMGLIVASHQAKLPLFYSGYPITPASDILHELSGYKHFGVKTFQAEDEIAAISSAIGASFAGNLAVTSTSGPGISLKTEAIGLAVMLELPLLICNIQRGGPSTGLPTKTEQADLFQALYGRHGEAPLPVLAVHTPSHCFDMVLEAVRIAINYMTPVFLLSDAYIASGTQPWKVPQLEELPLIKTDSFPLPNQGPFKPYLRNNHHARPWIVPGTPDYMHVLGGLEKEKETGNVSYHPQNHQYMVNIRKEKIENIEIPDLEFELGSTSSNYLILGWGSTFGAIKGATIELNKEGYFTAHLHLDYIYPMPKNTEKLLKSFEYVLIPEMNTGQLLQLVRAKFLINAKGIHKVQGVPFKKDEIKKEIIDYANRRK